MKKRWNRFGWICICTCLVLLSGCSLGDKLSKTGKKEKTNQDYVTLGEYKGVKLKTADVDKEVQEDIDETLDTYATYQKKKSGKVKKGDTVNIYYVGRVDGKKFDGGSCTKKDTPEGFDLEIGSGTFIPGFEDGLVGAKAGSVLDVDTTFPEEYPNNPDLAGKKAVFTVTVNYIQGKKVLPELTDAFVKKNLTSYASVDEYKYTLREHALQELAWDAVYQSSKINEYPQKRVDAMYDQLYSAIRYYLNQNSFQLSDYLAAQNTTSADFKKELNDRAKEDVGKQLIYGAIAEKEDIVVSEEQYQEELKSYLSTYSCDDEKALNEKFQEYYSTDATEMIKDDLLYKQVKEFIGGRAVEE